MRVERGAAARHALGCRKELIDSEHAVLQQIAETALRDELDRLARFDVLRQHEHAQLGMRGLELGRCASALVRVGRRHSNVDDDQVGVVLGDRRQQLFGVTERRDDVMSGVFEEPRKPLA